MGRGALIAVDALARALTAFLLLGLRRKGPGLWWTAICVTIALGATLGPTSGEGIPRLGVQIGGVASPLATVSPETWGLLFLAIELLLLHRAINLGRAGQLYGLVPLFLVWANVDESFAFGLLALAASAAGLALGGRRDPSGPVGPVGPGSSSGSASPRRSSTRRTPSASWRRSGSTRGWSTWRSGRRRPRRPPSSAPPSRPRNTRRSARRCDSITGGLVGLGLASFVLNRRGFSAGRFLIFAIAAVSWALAFNYFTAAFAVVLAATLSLNGQEWYLRTFGPEGRLGSGWTAWSTGGRLVTIALVFGAIALGVTGWGGQVGDSHFGFGFNPDDFPFEAAEALKDAPIEGNVLNTSLPQGDAIAWKALSKHKTFVDSRSHLFPQSVFEDLRALRNDIRDDAIEKWQPVLDRYKRQHPPDPGRRRRPPRQRTPDLREADEQPQLGPVLRRRLRRDVRPGRRQGQRGRRGLLQGQPARRRGAGLQAAQARLPLGPPADADLGPGRRHLPEPPAQPDPAPTSRRPSAGSGRRRSSRGPPTCPTRPTACWRSRKPGPPSRSSPTTRPRSRSSSRRISSCCSRSRRCSRASRRRRRTSRRSPRPPRSPGSSPTGPGSSSRRSTSGSRPSPRPRPRTTRRSGPT